MLTWWWLLYKVWFVTLGAAEIPVYRPKSPVQLVTTYPLSLYNSALTLCSSRISSISSFYFSSSFFRCFSLICYCSASFISYCCNSRLFINMFFSSLPQNIVPCFSSSTSILFSVTLPRVLKLGKSFFVCIGLYAVWFKGCCWTSC